jgi:hypothetical protein
VIEFDSESAIAIDPKRVERMVSKLNSRGELILDDLDSPAS